jgi:alpha/beta superfamily hydrolase
MSSKEHIELIEGPAGTLELCLQEPLSHTKKIGIVCHPHPLYGGTMHNKVVTTLTRVFRDLHMINVRFNFRGIGKSTGTFDEGVGETDDTLSVIQWAQERFPSHELFLAGFSFGAYVALRASTFTKVDQLITIAPAVNHASFSTLFSPHPWIIVIAENDHIVPPKDIYDWTNTLPVKPDILTFPETSHFFDGKLHALREQLMKRLQNAHTF